MPNTPNILLGFDFGMRRIGVAVGQCITMTAQPLMILSATDGIPDWQCIETLISEWQIDGCVVGLPLNMDGSEQTMTALARKFGQKLKGRFHLPVYYMDERLTSHAAQRMMPAAKKIDNIAAQLILESWLRSQCNPQHDKDSHG